MPELFSEALESPFDAIEIKTRAADSTMLFVTESEVRMHLLLFIVAHQLQ